MSTLNGRPSTRRVAFRVGSHASISNAEGVDTDLEGAGKRCRGDEDDNNGSASQRRSSPLVATEAVNADVIPLSHSRIPLVTGLTLAKYRSLKHGVSQRVYRRYYNTWLALLSVPRYNVTSGTQTSLLNNGIESLGSCAHAEEFLGSASFPSDDGQQDLARKGHSHSGRPPFRYSETPPQQETIAARSLPSHLKDYGSKSDLPLRPKVRRMASSGPAIAVPAVVPNPVRVYRF